MLLASLRLGFLLAAFAAWLDVAAAPRVWTLSGVQFADGAVATGYVTYDDVTNATVNWNVRVSGGAGMFLPFTYVSGNSASLPAAPFPGPRLYIYSDLDPPHLYRSFGIALLAPLDGSSATVTIDVSTAGEVRRASSEFFEDIDGAPAGPERAIAAGSLVLTTLPPPVTIVQVDEFHHPGLRHYFITADAAEKQLLDTGVHPGWERTGASFKAYATGSSASGSISPVCRYYGDPQRGLDSHFYSADSAECVRVFVRFGSEWLLESDNAFQINLPDKVTGACPSGTVPVYRLWNQPGDSSHRYTTSAAIKAQMLGAGYVAEGYGPDGVVMCAVQ